MRSREGCKNCNRNNRDRYALIIITAKAALADGHTQLSSNLICITAPLPCNAPSIRARLTSSDSHHNAELRHGPAAHHHLT